MEETSIKTRVVEEDTQRKRNWIELEMENESNQDEKGEAAEGGTGDAQGY